MFLTICVMFWNISKIYIFYFSMKNIKSNFYIVFFKFFPIIFSWWEIYPFPVTFIYKTFNFWHFLWLDWICYCFFVFYPIRRSYIWSNEIGIYFMTFVMQYLNIVEVKIATLLSESKSSSITSSASSFIIVYGRNKVIYWLLLSYYC